MKERQFNKLLKQFQTLSVSQQQRIYHYFETHSSIPKTLGTTNRPCPHCGINALRPWGSSHGLPRYRCSQCQRTSNPLTGTPLLKLHHRDCWLRYMQALIDGLSVRKAALICGIHKDTAFRWRHRFLALIQKHQADHEEGIVEADETFFLKSFKGQRCLPRPAHKRGGVSRTRGTGEDHVPVLIVRDRHHATADFILPKINKKEITNVLKPLIHQDSILCTDGAAVYTAFAKKTGIAHEAISASKQRVRGVFHIQNVNAYDSRLKTWMYRFHGVATKYLANYLGWRRLLERYSDGITPELCLKEALGRYPQQVMQT